MGDQPAIIGLYVIYNWHSTDFLTVTKMHYWNTLFFAESCCCCLSLLPFPKFNYAQYTASSVLGCVDRYRVS